MRIESCVIIENEDEEAICFWGKTSVSGLLPLDGTVTR